MANVMTLTDVAVITGAGGAMGQACANVLARTSDVVMLTDINATRLEATRHELTSRSINAVAMAGDFSDPSFPHQLAARAAELGGVRSLVHTAGLSPTMAKWDEILRVDLIAVAMLLDAFLPLVTSGSVAVCLASIAGHMGEFDVETDAVLRDPLASDFTAAFRALSDDEPDAGATYRLAKRGVLTLCERAAVTWGVCGGRVLSLSPGLINTEMGRLELEHNPIKHWLAAQTPIGSSRTGPGTVLPGRTSDIADTVEFLCSDRAAFLSGCDIRVDGGLVAAINHQ